MIDSKESGVQMGMGMGIILGKGRLDDAARFVAWARSTSCRMKEVRNMVSGLPPHWDI